LTVHDGRENRHCVTSICPRRRRSTAARICISIEYIFLLVCQAIDRWRDRINPCIKPKYENTLNICHDELLRNVDSSVVMPFRAYYNVIMIR